MRVSQIAKVRVLIAIVFCEGPRMGVASMVAGAQAMAVVVGRRVEAWTSPPWLMDHAGISNDRCGALRGSSGGGVLLLIQLIKRVRLAARRGASGFVHGFMEGMVLFFLAHARQKSDENGIGTRLQGYLR
jgi:hypothetical protein